MAMASVWSRSVISCWHSASAPVSAGGKSEKRRQRTAPAAAARHSTARPRALDKRTFRLGLDPFLVLLNVKGLQLQLVEGDIDSGLLAALRACEGGQKWESAWAQTENGTNPRPPTVNALEKVA